MTNKLKEQLSKEIPHTMQLTFCVGYRNRKRFEGQDKLQSASTCEGRNSLRSCDQTLMALCNAVRIVQQQKRKKKGKRHFEVCSLNVRLNIPPALGQSGHDAQSLFRFQLQTISR